MKIYAYYLRTESGDEVLKISRADYETASEFMKAELSCEYEAWKSEGYEDDEIPYATFLKEEYE